MKGKKVSVIHPAFGRGGTEAVCAWTLMGLSEDYDVELLTFDDLITLKALDDFYGTTLNSRKIKIRVLDAPRKLRRMDSGYHLLRQHLMMREVKKIKDDYDILFSTYNEMDFGKKGIQYIHFPFLVDFEYAKHKEADFGKIWYHRPSPIRWAYKKIGYILSQFNYERMKTNLTIVNSAWTGKIIREAYGIESIILYPPVRVDSPSVTSPEEFLSRELGFIAIGRIEPTKRFIEIVRIIQNVRTRGFDVHLHIIGTPGDANYVSRLKKLAKENSKWLFIEEGLSRSELIRLISRHRYGIHGKINEHFGIAVAEMVKLGLIVFVHNSGGQVEIVQDPALIYNAEEDAVIKIERILRDESLQISLHQTLLKRGLIFSVEAFTEKIRQLTEEL
ncbi:MAG: glycosyltransferase [candidate division WOR-3 bacterium]